MEISLDDRFDVKRLLCVNVALSHAVCLTKTKFSPPSLGIGDRPAKKKKNIKN